MIALHKAMVGQLYFLCICLGEILNLISQASHRDGGITKVQRWHHKRPGFTYWCVWLIFVYGFVYMLFSKLVTVNPHIGSRVIIFLIQTLSLTYSGSMAHRFDFCILTNRLFPVFFCVCSVCDGEDSAVRKKVGKHNIASPHSTNFNNNKDFCKLTSLCAMVSHFMLPLNFVVWTHTYKSKQERKTQGETWLRSYSEIGVIQKNLSGEIRFHQSPTPVIKNK